eukprot:7604656-Alexandrium_andersonii.AAC.1
MTSGRSLPQSAAEVDALIRELVACENMWFHQGAFSPCQLVFGANPRMPRLLMPDDVLGHEALADTAQ